MSKMWVTDEGGGGHWETFESPVNMDVISSGYVAPRISAVAMTRSGPLIPTLEASLPSMVTPYAATRPSTIGSAAPIHGGGGSVVTPTKKADPPPIPPAPPTGVGPITAGPENVGNGTFGPLDGGFKVLDWMVPGKQEDVSDFVPLWDSAKGFDAVPGTWGLPKLDLGSGLDLGGDNGMLLLLLMMGDR